MRPTDEDHDVIEILSRQSLTEWEENFLQSLSEQAVWSPKQGKVLDNLWTKYMEGGLTWSQSRKTQS